MRLAGNIFSVIAGLYLIAAPVWMGHLINDIPCSGIYVNLKGLPENNLVTEREIATLVRNSVPGLTGRKTGELNLSDIEEVIRSLREVKVAEAYFIIDGTLCLYVVQRNPVLRVIAGGGDYFLDDEGVLIRKRKTGAPRLHIATGNITITRAILDGVSVLDSSIRKSVLKDIYYLVNYIREDKFWSAQIDQIWVDPGNDINLIPRTGKHIVNIGNVDDLEEKLGNLSEFYRQVLPVTGWDAYRIINLEYKNQIVCTKNK